MQVMHLNTIAGKSFVSVVNGEDISSMSLGRFMAAHIQNIIAEGDGWPVDAVYKIETTYHTWPCGWDKDICSSYFKSKEELDEALEGLREWSLCEDNKVRVTVQEWDWGPKVIGTHHFG